MKTYTLLLFLLAPALFWAQDEILLDNPSFEGTPGPGKKKQDPFTNSGMKGWSDCGAERETAPDIHPGNKQLFFEVDQFANDGHTYIGMVVRQNRTSEQVGQKLKHPLKKDQTYELSVFLAKSEKYISPTAFSSRMLDFNKPASFRIWGGKEPCSKDELLAITKAIDHSDWREYTLTFQPSEDWEYIILGAYFIGEHYYNGNLLIDQLSSIRMVN